MSRTGPTSGSGRAEAATRPPIGDCHRHWPSIEKSTAPLRSFVAEPMRFGKLFLAGDAARIVPPTAAKGLKFAASDIYCLWQAFTECGPRPGSPAVPTALARVCRTERFSW